MIKSSIAGALGTLVLLASVANGDPDHDPHAPRPWSVTALIGTDVGLDFAAGVQLEAPSRLRFTATVGWMPRAYAWGLKKYYVKVYDGKEAVGEVLEDLLAGGFVARGNVGYRPMAERGLFFAAGYTFQTTSKNALVASAIEDATDRELPGAGSATQRRFETSMNAHMLDGTVGWQWALGSGFTLQAAVGLLVIVSTSTSFEPLYTPADPTLTQAFVDFAENLLDDAGTGIVAPLGTLFLGYTF